MSRSSSATPVSVYSGRQRLGSVEQRGDAFIAVDIDGVVVGRFETLHEAVAAFEEAAS